MLAPVYACAAVALALIAIPVVYLVVRTGSEPAHAWAVIGDAGTLRLAVRSVGLSVAVAASAVVIAVPYAFLVQRSDMPARRLLGLLGALPLVLPSYVGALALIGAFGPRGLLQRLLEPLGVERLPDVYGLPGTWAALTLFTYPYVLLLVGAAWRRVDESLERAARGLGHGPLRAFTTATLPQLRPAIMAGALLCVLYSLSDFGVVTLMRFDTFTRSIFVRYNSLYDREGAAALALVLCALTIMVLVVERRVLRGSPTAARRRVQAADHGVLVALGRWTLPALAFCVLVCSAGLFVPLGVLVWWAVTQRADTSLAEQVGVVLDAAVDSVAASASAAVVCVVLALAVAWLAVRRPGRLSGAIEAGTYAGFALPGIVAALGMVFFATRVAFPLYQTLWLLVAAYVVRFLPQAVGAARTAVERVNPTLEAAARGMGLGPLGAFRRITLPLAAPGVAAGAMLVFVTAMKELPATLILRPTGFETLATEIWKQSSVGDYPEAALPALALVALSALPLWLLVIRPGAGDRGGAGD